MSARHKPDRTHRLGARLAGMLLGALGCLQPALGQEVLPGSPPAPTAENDTTSAGQVIMLPPTAVPLDSAVLMNPTADEAYGAFQRGFFLTAMEMALPLAEGGDPAAQTLVAELFAEGFGVARNLEQARFWYSEAAEGGDRSARFKYALLLLADARTDPQRATEARELMRQAADAGHPSAQFNYGQMLVDETPGQAGLMAALPYFERAADQGIADAQYALSQIYLNAAGIEDTKRERAREWLFRAARAGYDTAQLDLAIWLIDGVGGDRDYEAGFRWMLLSANRGNVIAQNRTAHLLINAIGTRPNPVEAGKWYVLSRRAGLNDAGLEDFFFGLTDEEQRQAIEAANRFLG